MGNALGATLGNTGGREQDGAADGGSEQAWADDFLGRGHQRLEEATSRQFSMGVQYNSMCPLLRAPDHRELHPTP